MPGNGLWMRLALPAGELFLASDGEALFCARFSPPAFGRFGEDPVLRRAALELTEYFAGSRREFTVPVTYTGTEFQKSVWRAIREIPYGSVAPYGMVAWAAGYPGAARAVGSACRINPIDILIPCHRVVAANGIGGYGGEIERKRALLALEGRDDI